MNACPTTLFDVGIVRDILGSVDCNVQLYSAAGYHALAGPGSPLPAVMTALLTIYVALLGYRMLFAVEGIRLAQAPLIALKIGVILALTLNWSVFQTLVFNLGAQAPLEIGRVISRPMAIGSPSLASDPVQGIQTAYDELNADAAELAKKAGQAAAVNGQPAQANPGAAAGGNEAATATDLRRAAAALLASTAGVLGTAFIATGVLTAVGPVFIALFLFEATGGFFAGWLRALVAAILIPMVCWVGASVLLVVLSPRIDLLAQQRAAHAINLDAAAAASAIVVIFAAAQGALIVACLLVAGGFRLGRRVVQAPAVPAVQREVQSRVEVVDVRTRAETLATALRRSSTTSAREYASMTPASASPAPGVETIQLETPSRPARLGETYRRRTAVGDRARLGARA
jgi:type IV secretion system protein VirB6